MSDTTLIISIIVFVCAIYACELFYLELDKDIEGVSPLEGMKDAEKLEKPEDEGLLSGLTSASKSVKDFITSIWNFVTFDVIGMEFEYGWIIRLFLTLPISIALMYIIVKLLRGGG